jgi:hypothetical protein
VERWLIQIHVEIERLLMQVEVIVLREGELKNKEIPEVI